MNATAEQLPRPTDSVAQAKADLTQYGYCLLQRALQDDYRKVLLQRLQQQAAAEKQQGLAFEDGGPQQQWGAFQDEHGNVRAEAFQEKNGGINQRLWMLANKGKVFLDLLTLPRVNELVRHIMGQEYLLSSYTANIAKPGGVAMNLHTDQWWMPQPMSKGRQPLPVGSMKRSQFEADDQSRSLDALSPAACCNVIWMLNDFTESNGATRLVPGSHHSGRHPDAERDKNVATVAAAAPAGTALITDGRLWHGTGANISGDLRYALLTSYCGPQFRPQENFTIGVRDEVLQDASKDLLTLFGFKVWQGYGRTGHPTVDFVDRNELPAGELFPE